MLKKYTGELGIPDHHWVGELSKATSQQHKMRLSDCSTLAVRQNSHKRVGGIYLWPCRVVDGPIHTFSSQQLQSGQ